MSGYRGQNYEYPYLSGGDPCFGSSTPSCDQERKRMSGTQDHACKERPLFRADPIIIPDIVCICQQWVERQNRQGVDVVEPR
jgi:hypothetical protein